MDDDSSGGVDKDTQDVVTLKLKGIGGDDVGDTNSLHKRSTALVDASTRVENYGLTGILKQHVVNMRLKTHNFYQHVEIFLKLKQIIDGFVDKVMPNEAS